MAAEKIKNFLTAGLYLLVFFYPFVGWQLRWDEWNVPYVDLTALVLLTIVVGRQFWQLITGQTRKVFWSSAPGVIFALGFWLLTALALVNNDLLLPAVQYWLRPLVFFYLMFVVLPWTLIDHKKIMKNVLHVLLAVGLLVAFSGLLSILFGAGPWYLHRAVSFSWGDFNPLGGNHNAVAEVLVAIIPFTIILYLLSEKIKTRGWYLLAVLFMLLILILTFSRSGWLAILVELLILFFARYRDKINKFAASAVILGLLFAIFISYFTIWQKISWVQSSNANRILMTQIAFDSFWERPWLGHGLNTFQPVIGRTFVYRVEFADPLDSHGFVQKLMTETGILGLLAFVALLAALFRYYFQHYQQASTPHNRQLLVCLLMMFAGLVVFELFSTSYFLATMWLPIGVGLVGARIYYA